MVWSFFLISSSNNNRQGIMSFVEAVCSCWQMVLNEHGAIISTGLALSTFAGLFFFVFVLHKTLSPRQQQNLPSTKPQPQRPKSTSSSKKKKRKNGNGRSRTGKVRTEAQLPEKKDCSDDLQVEHSKESTSEENVQEGLPGSNRGSSLAEEEPKRKIPKEDVVLISQAPSSPLVRSRDRILSNSTAETLATSASGDQSYKSTSGRTTPTLPSGSPNEPEHKVKSTHRNTPRSTHRKSNNRRRGAGKKTDSRNSNNNNKQPSTSLSAASRWDALKPTNRNDHRQGHVLQSPPQVSSSARSQNRPVPSPEETSVSSSSSVAATDAPMIPLTRNVPGLDAGLIAPCPIQSLLPAKGSLVYSQSPSRYSLPHSPQNPMPSNLCDPMTSGLGCRTQQYDSSSHSVLNSTPSLPKNPANRPNWMGSPVRAPPGFSEPVSCQTPHSPMVAPSPSVQPPIFTDYTYRQEPRVKKNPFASDEEYQLVGRQTCEPYQGAKHNDVDQIEAELEELGGRMVGSILDF